MNVNYFSFFYYNFLNSSYILRGNIETKFIANDLSEWCITIPFENINKKPTKIYETISKIYNNVDLHYIWQFIISCTLTYCLDHFIFFQIYFFKLAFFITNNSAALDSSWYDIWIFKNDCKNCIFTNCIFHTKIAEFKRET